VKNNIVTHLLNLLETKGRNIQYGNENVTQLEHALQCAELAEKNNFSNEIITAALLHDIGHLLYDGEDPIYEGKDGYHENLVQIICLLITERVHAQLKPMLIAKDICLLLSKAIMIYYLKLQKFH